MRNKGEGRSNKRNEKQKNDTKNTAESERKIQKKEMRGKE